LETEEYLASRRLRVVPEGHLYLQVIAILPEYQGRGMGGRMLRHGLAIANDAAIPCYLETFGRDHVDLYNHFGFEVADSGLLPGMQEPVFLMTHQPPQKHARLN
ncbi:MAG: GNAT family N-acetyltransferase, partial [Dehalococcoidia bacterium]|nr:GNAT family N-acetyltransferase [Dehalococcoidia bacterium]